MANSGTNGAESISAAAMTRLGPIAFPTKLPTEARSSSSRESIMSPGVAVVAVVQNLQEITLRHDQNLQEITLRHDPSSFTT